VEMDISRFLALPEALQRRLLRFATRHATGVRIDFAHVETLLRLARQDPGQGRVQLPGLDVVRSFERMRITLPDRELPLAPFPVTVPGSYPSPGRDAMVHLELTGGPALQNGCDTLNLELLPEQLELRTWRAGDRYRPLRLGREQKLKDLFQNARIPSWKRARWPILSTGDKILWVREFGLAEPFAGIGPGRRLRVREEIFATGESFVPRVSS
jgi:tRNA(Ile)-lysidine synthase